MTSEADSLLREMSGLRISTGNASGRRRHGGTAPQSPVDADLPHGQSAFPHGLHNTAAGHASRVSTNDDAYAELPAHHLASIMELVEFEPSSEYPEQEDSGVVRAPMVSPGDAGLERPSEQGWIMWYWYSPFPVYWVWW